jgi:predicted Zn-dependent protease with MMP-like domain
VTVTGSPPTPRRILLSALAALVLGLGAASLIAGFSDSFPLRLLQGLAVFAAGAVIIGGAAVLVMIRVAGWRDPESEEDFEALVQRSERLAAEDSWGDSEDYETDDDDDLFDPYEEEDFKALVRAAVDDLPLEFHRALEHVAVVVSDGGRRQRAYGLYQGDSVAADYFHDRIVIFRDTLLRDFGHDPELLKAQVTRTVRHELAHHLGWDEKGVRGLGNHARSRDRRRHSNSDRTRDEGLAQDRTRR